MTTDEVLQRQQPAQSWPELQPGEKVRLELEVTVGYPLGDEDDRTFYLAHEGKTVSLYLPVDHPQVRVTRAEPADGVPQPGELWADQTGVVYLVRCLTPGRDDAANRAWLVSTSGPHYSWREVHTGPDGPIRRLMTADEIASYAGYAPRYIVGAS